MDRLQADERFSQHKLDEFSDAVRSTVPPHIFKRYASSNEEDLARFIVAREGNIDAALQQFLGAVDWAERTYEPSERVMTCKHCLADPTSHSHIPIGLERTEQSTIIYGCPARATHADVTPIVEHVARQLEYCFRLPTTGSRWVWCVDYNAFGMKEALQGKLAARFGALFSNHMPERLHKILLLNPPSIFQLLLKAARPFVDQRTMEKLCPVTGTTEEVIRQLRDEHSFPTEALHWLETVLNQKLPAKLPKLPNVSRLLMLPSLRSMFEYELSLRDGECYSEKRALINKAALALTSQKDSDHDKNEGRFAQNLATLARLDSFATGCFDDEGNVQITVQVAAG